MCAENGRKARRLLELEQFDLVVSDMLMPDSDGIELLAIVRTLPSPPRVIVMSGGGIASVDYYLKLAKKLGAHSVLQKPFATAALLSTVNAAFEP